MSGARGLTVLLTQFEQRGIPIRTESRCELAPAVRLRIDAPDWRRAAQAAFASGFRWVAGWGDHEGAVMRVFSCLEGAGDYLVLEALLRTAAPELPSQSSVYPVADRFERHTRDLLGIAYTDAPDTRRWLRHQAWDEGAFPLRHDYPVAGRPPEPTPADGAYPFRKVAGSGVYEIPVGPVHAGIIEPGHFRFSAVGEEILSLEEHLGYVHKGVEKLAVGRDPVALARLAGRVSGDTTVGHAWAACMAMERAAGCEVPARANELRALLCERERVANHLGDIGAICNDVGFSFAHYQCARLRECWQRRNALLFGHRLLMDCIVPGGICRDIQQAAIAGLLSEYATLRAELTSLFDLLQDIPALQDRLLTTGWLSPEDARELGCTGYVGKASGHAFDVRANHPYPPYDRFDIAIPVLEGCDVMARMQLRMREIEASLKWMEHLLGDLSDGPVAGAWPGDVASVQGMGFVDGWRGEIMVYLRFDGNGRVARYFPCDPSWHHWPALERLIEGNIVPDFPVCNKSVNGSYSGTDL